MGVKCWNVDNLRSINKLIFIINKIFNGNDCVNSLDYQMLIQKI